MLFLVWTRSGARMLGKTGVKTSKPPKTKPWTFPKSISRSIVNGNGARHRKKSLPTPSRNALFRSRAHFWSILGSNLGPRTASLGRLSADFRDFFVIFGPPAGSQVVFLCSRVLGEGAGPDSGSPGDPPGRNLKTIFNDSLCRFAS